jgi:DNA-binding CsgD family transcriptional regulator
LGSLARAIGVRWAAATGRLPDAEELLPAEGAASNDLTRAAIVGAAAQVSLVRGVLGATARTARNELVRLRPPNSTRMHAVTNVAYESVARVAFFSGDRDVLAWAAAALSEGANSKSTRRHATVAAAHLSVLDDASPAWPAVDSTLRDRIVGSVTGGGLIQRETPYLALAAGDPDWIAAERAVTEQFATDNDQRALLHEPRRRRPRVLGGDNNAAERHWHDLLAAASEHGFGLLWIDALEGLAICGAGAASDQAARLAGAAQSAAGPRLPVPVPSPWRAAVGIGRRPSTFVGGSDGVRTSVAGNERGRPGWAALTPTEADVARVVADGLTNKQAASRLFMSVPTVKTHLRHIFVKLEIDNRSQLVTEAAKNKR